MQQTIKFDIALPLHGKVKRIKEKSFYDHNYYQLEEYGDWIDFGAEDNNVLYETYDECANCYSYYFGHFDTEDKFVKAFGYTTQDDILENIDIE